MQTTENIYFEQIKLLISESQTLMIDEGSPVQLIILQLG